MIAPLTRSLESGKKGIRNNETIQTGLEQKYWHEIVLQI